MEKLNDNATTNTNSETFTKEMIEDMILWLYSNNLMAKTKELNSVCHIPISITPSPIHETLFKKIEFYQTAFNRLIDLLSRDYDYLIESLEPIAKFDPFVEKFLNIAKKAHSFEHKQLIQLGIFRNDFMIDLNKKFVYQVEYNTIASSLGSFTDKLKEFYRYFGKKYQNAYSKYFDNEKYSLPLDRENVIENIGASMFEAVKLFSPDGYKNTIIIALIDEKERNIFDCNAVCEIMENKYGIEMIRMTMKDVRNKGQKDENGNILIHNKIVSLFYFRSGYSEVSYPDEESWEAREFIELSTAIKCPNINTFLCTFKIFQVLFLKEENVKRFIKDDLIAKDIIRFFVKIYNPESMTEEELAQLYEEIRADNTKYIVKPMKEGGGNNYYNEQILPILDNKTIMNASIVMERIKTPTFTSNVLRNHELIQAECVSEFSCYGTMLSKPEIVINKRYGFVVRTKESKEQEGGVCAGFSSVDMPLLIISELPSDNNVIDFSSI